MSKIDFSIVLVNLAGKALKDQDNQDLTLGSTCVSALLTMTEKDSKLAGLERKKRADLADRIYDKKEPVNLDVKEISLLKDLVGEVYSPLIVKRVWDLLDPDVESTKS